MPIPKSKRDLGQFKFDIRFSDNIIYVKSHERNRTLPQNYLRLFFQYSPYDSRQDTTGSPAHCGNPRHSVFPAERAAHLDSRLRRFLYRPDRFAERYVKPSNRSLISVAGQGFFTREFAKKVGDTGMVIAVDLQEEMLRILSEKLKPEGLLPRIKTHRCDPDSLGLSPGYDGKIDVCFHDLCRPRSSRCSKDVSGNIDPACAWRLALHLGTPDHCFW